METTVASLFDGKGANIRQTYETIVSALTERGQFSEDPKKSSFTTVFNLERLGMQSSPGAPAVHRLEERLCCVPT